MRPWARMVLWTSCTSGGPARDRCGEAREETTSPCGGRYTASPLAERVRPAARDAAGTVARGIRRGSGGAGFSGPRDAVCDVEPEAGRDEWAADGGASRTDRGGDDSRNVSHCRTACTTGVGWGVGAWD